MTYRLAAILVAVSMAGQAPAQEPAATNASDARVTIGVRTDARPFAYHDEFTGRGGYLYQLCIEAVARTGHDYALQDATPADRDKLLNISERKFDLLCDPTTLSIVNRPGFTGG